MFIASFATGPWQANCYIVAPEKPGTGHQSAIVIDPGVDAAGVVEQFCASNHLELAAVYCTHGHIDHIADAAKLANKNGVEMWLHPDDFFMMTEPVRGLGAGSEPLIEKAIGGLTLERASTLRELADGQRLDAAGVELEVKHAPGHSPGCVVFAGTYDTQPIVFTGDVIFAGSVGRVDLPRGDASTMMQSLAMLGAWIDPDAGLLPGHGPSSQMSHERANNMYLKEALA